MADYINNDVAMSWDDTIENDSEFVLLPEGDYDFEIVGFERKRFEGSDKMSACPMAEISIKLFDKKDPSKSTATIKHNLFLNRKCEWKLCEFFTAIGDRKHGEPLRMNWTAVKGKTGRCKVAVRKWTKNDGTEGQSNEIKSFYEPANPPAGTPQKAFVPGKF